LEKSGYTWSIERGGGGRTQWGKKRKKKTVGISKTVWAKTQRKHPLFSWSVGEEAGGKALNANRRGRGKR